MESFIYEELNRPSREKDETIIPFYGGFIETFSRIIYNATSHLKDIEVKKSRKFYRSLKMNT